MHDVARDAAGDAAGDAARDVMRDVAVIGGGTMGTGIAYVFAMSGRCTLVVEPGDARDKR